jgi:outer membrane protein assembly factor BamE
MRQFLISALFLSLVAGCSSVKLGPHHIDVQQGNALDQENVARLKLGLNRSQVRFLLGTPLVVDPFRTDRWDYVYVYYKAGKLAEQKRIALFFDGDTLARMEGDLPVAEPVVQPEPKAEIPASPPELAVTTEKLMPSSVPSPITVPGSVESRPSAEMSLRPETDVAQIKPDATPSFPESSQVAATSDAPILKSLNAWANAWSRRDDEAYLAAYDASFIPQGGGSRADWEKRRHLLFGVTKNIELKIDSPSVDRIEDGIATVTFNQFYRSDSYRDAVVKQLRMVERDGRWLIVEEKVLSTLRNVKP